MAKSKVTPEQQQLNDLANRISRSTVAIIDTMVTRGAFKGEELTTIGQLRDQAVQAVALYETVSQQGE
jgi:hypothetical protein